MAYIKSFKKSDFSTYEYHRIVTINLPTFVRNVGWGEGLITIESFVNKDAAQGGAQPVKSQQFPIPFTAFPTIVWDSQHELLAWAYESLKPFSGEFYDSEDDKVLDYEGAVQ